MTRKYCEQTEMRNTYAQQIFNYNSVLNVSADKGTKIFLNVAICDIYLYLPEHTLRVNHVSKIPVHILFCLLWYSPLSSYLYSPLEELDGTVMFLLQTKAISCGTPSSRREAVLFHKGLC